jgi:glycosyltransferase involved in cell wall biosynthesis
MPNQKLKSLNIRLLVIGNGSIGQSKDNQFYINNHTGNFLSSLNKNVIVKYAENVSVFSEHNNLQNFELQSNGLNFETIQNNKRIGIILKIFRLLKGCDIAYIFYPGTLGKVFAVISLISGKKYGFYIRGQYYNQNRLDKFLLKKARFILTVSPNINSDLIKFCSNTELIKPMISIDSEDLKINREFVIPKTWKFVYVGRVELRKGIYDLIEIADVLINRGVNLELSIIGGGDLFDEVNEIINKNKLNEKIKILGLISSKETLKKIYDQSDVFIFTSHDEGFPRVLYEAMASSLPIFTTFVGGIPGRMINQENCIEIPVNDSSNAAEIIFNNLRDIELLQKIGTNAQRTLTNLLNSNLLSHENTLLKKIQNEKSN